MMDPAQLERCDLYWHISLAVISISFILCSITVLLRILTTHFLSKPTKPDDRRFTLAEWTMTAAFVSALRSKVELSLSDEIMRAGLEPCHLYLKYMSLVATQIR